MRRNGNAAGLCRQRATADLAAGADNDTNGQHRAGDRLAGRQQADGGAGDLAHPRWLYVLPKGDVLVAETNAPARPEAARGIKAWVTGLMTKRAGAGVTSANRITLLRDSDGDGVADFR